MITRMELVDVDPDLAEFLLKSLNLRNRRVSEVLVNRYATDMTAGRWETNGVAIAIYIGKDGARLINGQHRLLAVIRSGVTVKMLFVEEDVDSYSTYDTSGTRNIGQLLAMAGAKNPIVVGAMLRLYRLWTDYSEVAWGGGMVPGNEVFAMWDNARDVDRMEIEKCANFHAELHSHVPATTAYAGLAYIVARHSPHADRWLEFHEVMVHGADVKKGDPRLALREWWFGQSRNKRVKVAEMAERQRFLHINLRAWNAYVTGQKREYYAIKSLIPMPPVR